MHMLGTPRTMQRRPPLRRRRDRHQGVPRGPDGFATARGIPRSRIMLDPGIGVRQDRRAQPRAAPAAGRAGRARTPGRDRHLAQVVPRQDHRARGGRPPAATVATNVLAYERGARVFRVHDVGAGPRRAHGHGCYGQRAHGRDDPTSTTRSTRTTGDEEHPEPEVTIEISGLSLYTHVGVTAAEREVGQRLLLDLRLDVGECDATVTDRIEDTVDYAQVCEHREPGRPAAHVQDARAAVRGDRRPADRAVRRPRGVGQGRQARAADGAAGQ